jgi:hypothetical protein
MNENEETEVQKYHRLGIRSKLQMHSAVAAAMLVNYNGMYGYGGQPQGEPEISKRPCLNCGKEKQHNNAYCSGECCREHRTKKALDFMPLYGGKPGNYSTSSEQPNTANVSKEEA